MKFIEKASGWLIVTGLAIAVLLAFNYLDVFIMFGFRSAGLSTKIYRGAYSITAALANTVLFGLVFIICKKIKRPVLDVKKNRRFRLGAFCPHCFGNAGVCHDFHVCR